MRLAGWTCASDGKFRCMQSTMALRAVEGLRPAKYYGKWSFHRVLGTQEIISSLASTNAAVHVRYLPELLRVSLDRNRPEPARRRAPVARQRAREHQRMDVERRVPRADTPRTHFMDYASANAIFFALFAVLVACGAAAADACVALRLRFVCGGPRTFAMNVPSDGLKYQYERNMRVMMARGALVAAVVVGLPRAWGRKSWSRIRAGAPSSETSRVGTPPSPRLPIPRPWEAY